jgi:hypothetical protein
MREMGRIINKDFDSKLILVSLSPCPLVPLSPLPLLFPVTEIVRQKTVSLLATIAGRQLRYTVIVVDCWLRGW